MADETAREAAIAAPPVPASIAACVGERRWTRNLVGEAGALVYRLQGPRHASDLYLKHGTGPLAADVIDEMVRLRWLAGHIDVPTVRHCVIEDGAAWLVTTAMAGHTAYQALEAEPARRPAIVAALAAHMRRLHAIPVATCPFNSDHRLRLGLAHARMTAGLVDLDDFGDAHAGWSAQAVWDEVTSLLPLAPDRVVTHGDYSLDNIILDGTAVTGCIDVGRAGIADRWQDIAILLNCLEEFGDALGQVFLDAYGIAADAAKMRFHLSLDEFF